MCGLGGAEKSRSVKDAIRIAKVEVWLLKESKLGEEKLRIGWKLFQSLNMQGELIHANGSAGGLVTCWGPSKIIEEEVVKNSITLVF